MKKNLYILLLLVLSSCVGRHVGWAPTGSEDLELTSNKAMLQEGDFARLSVYYKGHLLSTDYDITTKINGENVIVDKHKFERFNAGEYSLIAEYVDPETQETIVSKSVSITVYSPNESADYYKQVNMLYYTGIWCVNCPDAAKAIKSVQHEVPGRLLPMAIHIKDVLVSEEEYEDAYNRYIPLNVWPTIMPDFVKELFVSTTKHSTVKTLLDQRLLVPASCGIALYTEVENNTLNIDINIKFSKDGEYKIILAILEDYIQAIGHPQIGSSDGDKYIHYNALRTVITEDALGDSIGHQKAGDKYSTSYYCTLKKDWNIDNSKIIAVVLEKQANGDYHSTNTTEVYLGGSVPILYEY